MTAAEWKFKIKFRPWIFKGVWCCLSVFSNITVWPALICGNCFFLRTNGNSFRDQGWELCLVTASWGCLLGKLGVVGKSFGEIQWPAPNHTVFIPIFLKTKFEESLLVAMWPVSHALLKRKLCVLGSKNENRIGPSRFKHELPDFGSKIRNRSFVEATNCNKTVLHQRLPSWSSFYWLAIKHGAATTECFYSFNYSKVLLGVSIWLILVRF